ncbi:MAG TPA: MBL fold metallo-hydrolase [Rhizomicrobium sp.]|nr:MBL fold metallo-hydrolase [Rhizomicrobium sp.]
MKIFSFALLAALAIATPCQAVSDGFVRQTMVVAPHVHLIYRPGAINAPYEGNSIVIEQSDGLVVVDAGGSPPSGEYIVAEIRKFSNKPVKDLIYTHYHGDHNLGAGAFLKAWPGLKIISTVATRANMTGKPMNYIKTYGADYAGEIDYAKKQAADASLPDAVRAGWQQYVDVGDSMVAAYKVLQAYPATVTFTDKYVIADSAEPVEIAFLGKANTDGDAVIWVPNEKVLCAGDIVVNPMPYAAASYPQSWIDVLNKLKAYNYAYLIPGHGEVQTDTVYVDKVIAALEDVRAQVTPLAKKGVKLEDVYKQTDFEKLKASFAGDDKWKRLLLNSFFLHSIIKNAYFEATGQPIEQGTS